MSLGYGLNIKKRPGGFQIGLSKKTNPLLDNSDNEDIETSQTQRAGSLMTAVAPSKRSQDAVVKALQQDSAIFDYDAAHDAKQAQIRSTTLANANDSKKVDSHNSAAIHGEADCYCQRAQSTSSSVTREITYAEATAGKRNVRRQGAICIF